MGYFQRTEAVRKLFYANIVVFLISLLFPSFMYSTFTLFPVSHPDFSIFGILGHLFMHGGLLHLAFNMLALISIGPMIENTVGTKKFWIYYFIMGLGAAVAQTVFTDAGGVGASGAIFGLFAYLTAMNPNLKFAFPPLKAKWLMGIYVAFSLYAILSGNMCGIGHFAHLGGAAMGAGLFYLNKYIKIG